MITEIDKETIDFLGSKKLTFNQFCICLLLHEGNVAKIIQYTNEVGYLTGGTVLKPDRTVVNELDDLVARGFVKFAWINKGNKWDLDNYSVTEKFSKGFLDQYKIYAKELWEAYPKQMWIAGEAKDVAKVYDIEEFEKKYVRILKEDINVHQKVMDALRMLKAKSSYAPVKLENFLASRYWENITAESNERVGPRFL
jgi:hypothetical protein